MAARVKFKCRAAASKVLSARVPGTVPFIDLQVAFVDRSKTTRFSTGLQRHIMTLSWINAGGRDVSSVERLCCSVKRPAGHRRSPGPPRFYWLRALYGHAGA